MFIFLLTLLTVINSIPQDELPLPSDITPLPTENSLDDFAHPTDPLPITPQNTPLGPTNPLNLTASDTSIVDMNPSLPKSFWKDPFSTTNATFCWKRTRFRKLSLRHPCKTNFTNHLGICYRTCEGEIPVGPLCWSHCPSTFPVPCGLGCAKSHSACRSDRLNKITSVAILAFNLGAAAHLAAGVGHSITKLALTHDNLVLAGKGVKEAAERALAVSLQHFLKNKLGPVAAAKMAQTLATDAFQDEGGVDWTIMDPTGVTAVINNFYRPICPKL